MVNITKTILFTIAIIVIIIAVSYIKKSIIFVIKKVIALISIQTMSNKRQKNFRDKTENFVEIRANITHF